MGSLFSNKPSLSKPSIELLLRNSITDFTGYPLMFAFNFSNSRVREPDVGVGMERAASVSGTDAEMMSGTFAVAGIERGISTPFFFVIVCTVTIRRFLLLRTCLRCLFVVISS
jgi:hypothetical protein